MKLSDITIRRSIFHMLISTFSFGIMNVVVKLLGDFPAMEMMFFRCAVSMILCFAALAGQNTDWRGSNNYLLIARGVFGTIAVYTFFVTLDHMPLGTAVTIQYLSPVFTTVFAIYLLREPVRPVQWFFFAACFGGVLLIKGFDSRISMGMLAVGIISAAASGVAYNLVRNLRGKENPMVVVLHFQIVGVIVGLVCSIFNWRMPSGKEWIYLLLTGICTQVGQVNLTKALQGDKIANIAILNYIGILYALVFGYVLFDERYSVVAFVGILLVVGGVLINIVYRNRNAELFVEAELTGDEE